jgi:hypothetical protein
MGRSMGMAAGHLLPDWLRMVWIVIYIAILVLHLRHAVSMRGQQRIWHSGHSLMYLAAFSPCPPWQAWSCLPWPR